MGAMTKSAGDHKLAQAKAAEANTLARAEDQAAQMDRMLQDEAAEVEKLQTHLKDLNTESEKLKCEVSTLKEQYEKATGLRQKLEQELAEARKEFAQQRLQLQAAFDQINPQNASAETEIREGEERFANLRREMTSNETQLSSRLNALDDLMRDAQWQLSDAQNRLAETVDTLERETQEAADNQRAVRERQKTNEDALERRRREIADEKGRFVLLIQDQRQNALRDIAQTGHQTEAHAMNLRQVKEEYAVRSVTMEREKTRIMDESRQAAVQAQQDHIQALARAEALERELTRARHLLAESRTNHSWIRQERDREQQGIAATRARLGDELRRVQGNLATSADTEAAVEAQVKAAAAQQAEQRQRLALKMDDVRQRLESPERTRPLHGAQDEQAKISEKKTRDDLHVGRAELASVTRDIEQLKHNLAEAERQKAVERQVTKRTGLANNAAAAPTPMQRRSCSVEPVGAPSSSLDAHIQRLQRHTQELRRHGAAVSTGLPGLLGAPPI